MSNRSLPATDRPTDSRSATEVDPIPTLAAEDVLLTIPDQGKTRKNHLGLILRQYTRPDGSSYQTTEIPSSVLRSIGLSRIEDSLSAWIVGEQRRSRAISRKALILTLLKDTNIRTPNEIAILCNCSPAYVRLVRKDALKEPALGTSARKIISYWNSNPGATTSEVATACGSSPSYVRRMRTRHSLGSKGVSGTVKDLRTKDLRTKDPSTEEPVKEWTRDWKRTPLHPSPSKSWSPSL